MPRKREDAWPPRMHRHKDGARVTWGGQWFHLGPWGSEEARATHARLIGIWRLDPYYDPEDVRLLVSELCQHYVAARPFPETKLKQYKAVLREFAKAHAKVSVDDFGPVLLAAWQRGLAERVHGEGKRAGSKVYTRETVAMYVRIVRGVWKWGVATERVTPDRWHALGAVRGLRRGEGRQGKKRKAVSDDDVNGVLDWLPASVAGLVQVQRFTGARPSELFGLRPIDLDRSGPVWVCRLEEHKTDEHGKERALHFGPLAQAVLRECWPEEEDGLFFPVRRQKYSRVCPVYPSEKKRRAAEATRRERRRVGQPYTAGSYRTAIGRACERAGVPVWTPYQLRRSRLTEIWNAVSAEASAAVGGHSLRVNESYTRQRSALAARVASETG